MNIKISSLKKVFGEKTAVDIDDFTINSGDMLGLVGNNGAGKTTLFRLILDLLKADDGSVLLTPKQTPANENPSAIDPSKDESWKSLTGAYIDEGFLIDFLTPEEYFSFVGKKLITAWLHLSISWEEKYWVRKNSFVIYLQETSRK